MFMEISLTRGSIHAVNDEGLKNLLMSWYYAGEVHSILEPTGRLLTSL
jgi:hypothetical protein